MKKELERDIQNKYVKLEEMVIMGTINTIGRLEQFQDLTLRQYRVENAERIESVDEKLRSLEQEAAKYCSYKTKLRF